MVGIINGLRIVLVFWAMVFLASCSKGFDSGDGYRINGIKFRPSCDVKVQKECVGAYL